jgi:hypothetical protein
MPLFKHGFEVSQDNSLYLGLNQNFKAVCKKKKNCFKYFNSYVSGMSLVFDIVIKLLEFPHSKEFVKQSVVHLDKVSVELSLIVFPHVQKLRSCLL